MCSTWIELLLHTSNSEWIVKQPNKCIWERIKPVRYKGEERLIGTQMADTQNTHERTNQMNFLFFLFFIIILRT